MHIMNKKSENESPGKHDIKPTGHNAWISIKPHKYRNGNFNLKTMIYPTRIVFIADSACVRLYVLQRTIGVLLFIPYHTTEASLQSTTTRNDSDRSRNYPLLYTNLANEVFGSGEVLRLKPISRAISTTLRAKPSAWSLFTSSMNLKGTAK